MTTILRGNPGLAAGVDTENFKQFDLFLSDQPGVYVTEHDVGDQAAETVHALYSVVKLAANRIDGLADNTSGSHANGAVGVLGMTVTAQTAVARGAADRRRAKIYRGGHFNGDVLVWHKVTFLDPATSDGLRMRAFDGAPAPTNIVVGFNRHHRP